MYSLSFITQEKKGHDIFTAALGYIHDGSYSQLDNTVQIVKPIHVFFHSVSKILELS